jgi:hypothetical protein
VLHNRQRTAIGSPDEMREKLTNLAETFKVNEIVISTFTERSEDRLHSYELLAELFGLEPLTISAVSTNAVI